MALYDVDRADAIYASSNTSNNSGDEKKIGFFSLKNDNDTATVRILLNDIHELEVLTVHDVPITDKNGNEKNRKISCIKEDNAPLATCPLCTVTTVDPKTGNAVSKYPSKFKVYIKLIRYTTDANGKTTGEPLIWERSYKYVQALKDKLKVYGTLANRLCLITRHGKAGDTNTDYGIEVLPGDTGVYTDANYPPQPNAFDGYSALGRIVLSKTFDDMREYTTTGKFPFHGSNNSTNTTTSTATTYTAQTQQSAPATPAYTAPVNTQVNSVADDELPF